ncbi:hypothetical protein [Streptomyces sp. KR80]|uniref:hypothetical protein n=1 Tax=Streptomyces sp. KR80 TaxID=3457426 RepID=UPI003FD3952A
MRRHLCALAVLVITLTACGSGAQAPDQNKPGGAERTTFLAKLKAIHPALVTDEHKAMGNALTLCRSITGVSGADKPIPSAEARFSTKEHQVTEAEAKAIIALVEAAVCRPKK